MRKSPNSVIYYVVGAIVLVLLFNMFSARYKKQNAKIEGFGASKEFIIGCVGIGIAVLSVPLLVGPVGKYR